MAKTIIVCGYGPGISKSVAEKFGKEGFSVALAARNKERLAAGVKELEGKGIKAAAFPTDLGDQEAVKKLVADAREKLGPIAIVHYNAYLQKAGDLNASQKDWHDLFDTALLGIITATNAAHDDLKAQKGAVLITNGGFGYFDPQMDEMCVKFGAIGLGVANAARHKLAGILAKKLAPDGIYVGEVMVLGTIKGSAFDQQGNGNLEGSKVADTFFQIFTDRKETYAVAKP